VKVYIDTPTPFKASVAQGINVTYTWSFDNRTDQVFHTDYLSCYSQCYESTAVSISIIISFEFLFSL